MKHPQRRIAGLLPAVAALGLSLPLWGAQDFGAYQTQELMQMRSQQTYWDQVDKDAYRNEVRNRMQDPSHDGRTALNADGRAGRRSGQQAQGQRLRDGSGSGGGYGRGDRAADEAARSGGGYGRGRGGGGRGR